MLHYWDIGEDVLIRAERLLAMNVERSEAELILMRWYMILIE